MNYVYVIMLTARRDASDSIEGMTAGADDFIVKPFQPAELVLRVRAGERLLALETRDLLIFVLAKLAESRDNDTGAIWIACGRIRGLSPSTWRRCQSSATRSTPSTCG